MTSPQMVTVEMGLLEEPAYECLSLLESLNSVYYHIQDTLFGRWVS